MNSKVIIGAIVLVALTGGGYLAYRYLKKQKELLEDYEIDFLGISFSNFSEDLVTANFAFRIHNKASIEATVERLYADVYLNGKQVGNMINNGAFLVPAKGSADAKFQFTFASKEILKNIVSSIFSLISTKDVPYQLKGLINVKSSGISIPIPFDYSGYLTSDMLSTSATTVVKNK